MTSKNILFLWDHKFMQRSAGIFTESAKNVTIRGHEYISNGNQSQSRPNQNRIQKHEWLCKEVHIKAGEFKGQKGRVTAVNGQLAEIETSIRAKKVYIELTDLTEILDEHNDNRDQANNHQAGGNTPGYGGATVYDAGKTPNPMSTYFAGDGDQYSKSNCFP